MHIFRTIIHYARKILHRTLGTRNAVEPYMKEVFERIDRIVSNTEVTTATAKVSNANSRIFSIVDRIAVLESQINWRIYGLPARIENIKLEQAAILAGSGDVESALELLSKSALTPSLEIITASIKSISAHSAAIFGSSVPNETNFIYDELKEKASLLLIRDSANLFNESWALNLSAQTQMGCALVEVSLASTAALFSPDKFDFIWFSNILERLTPIQTQILVQKASKSLLKDGLIAGYFLNYDCCDHGLYWQDPRRLRPMTQVSVEAFFKAVGFTEIQFRREDDGFTHFRLIH